MDAKKVTISPAQGELTIGTSGLTVRERSREDRPVLPVSQQTASVFYALVQRARRETRQPRITIVNQASPRQHRETQSQLSDQKESTRIFAISLQDIEKALTPKKHTDPQQKLPSHYHEFLPLFDRAKADQLPPHRPGVDHEIP